ncbi:hypothetical protein N665_0430s0011 [Sinapis alba]|nr:hypothetical protein N665_0430s0011 [Sinapis alba]
MVEEAVGEDVWSELRESAIGVIVNLKELDYIWSAKVVYYFLANQLTIKISHEILFLIECMPFLFSLYEFGEITGLNCDPLDKNDVWNMDHQEFWLEMKLQALFPDCRNWSQEKRVMIGLLCMLSISIFGISSNNIISLHCAKREGNRIEGADVPLLSWLGSCTHINFSDLCAQENRKYQKVCVRHMIMKPMEDIYLNWDNDKIHSDLDNMIKDILIGQLNEKFWDAMPTTKFEKRKYAHNVVILGLVESIKILTEKIEGIDVSVADKVNKALEATIDAKVEVRVGVYDSDLRMKIEKLEEEINYLKSKADVNISPDVANSKAYEDEDACSNDLKKINSQDGLLIDCVELTNKEVKKTEKNVRIPLRIVKQEKSFEIPQLNDESISTGTLASTLEESTRRHKHQLTKTQVWPYVGNSTVKCIITAYCSSKAYVSCSKQEQSQYSSSRIAFLSRWFVNRWVNDYKKWDQNKSDLDQWVAIHIDLPKEVIYVYDSIHTHLSNKQMIKECRSFMRMIPAVLNKMLLAKMRKKSEKQFTYRRKKKIPQNENPRFCGVYSLKYIEFLAVGCNFDGLNDQIIIPLRLKLAADFHEKVTETAK